MTTIQRLNILCIIFKIFTTLFTHYNVGCNFNHMWKTHTLPHGCLRMEGLDP